MWIVLVDRSGSMANRFGKSDPRALGSKPDHKSRLHAAIESLRDELRSREPATEIAILAFNHECEQLFHGSAGEIRGIDKALSTLTAEGRTDLGIAINLAVDKAERAAVGSQSCRILVITDGEVSDARAIAGSGRAASAGIAVDILLLDGKRSAERLAAQIAELTGGTWSSINSRVQLERATAAAAGEMREQAEQAAVAQFERSVFAARQAAKTAVASKEPITFTARHPSTVRRHGRYRLLVVLSRSSDDEGRLSRLNGADDEFEQESNAVSAEAILASGTKVVIEPGIEGAESNPSSQEILWSGSIDDASFTIKIVSPLESGSLDGFVNVYANQLHIAAIPVVMALDNDLQGPPRMAVASSTAVEQVFASYAHEDESVVRACEELYRGLGIALIVDRQHLYAGQRWKEALDGALTASDIFQLFWSEAASGSAAVADEWQFALALAPSKSGRFVRPVYWSEPMPPPPPELKAFHFHRLRLNDIAAVASESGRRVEAAPSSVEADYPVLALASGDGQLANDIQRTLRRVVPYIEDVTGLRYQVPLTLLVDDSVVALARSRIQPRLADTSAFQPASPGDLADDEAALLLLRCLAEAFTDNSMWSFSAGQSSRERAHSLGLTSDREFLTFDHVHQEASRSFAQSVRLAFEGESHPQRPTIAEVLATPAPVHPELQRLVINIQALASQDDRSAVEEVLGTSLFRRLQSQRSTLDSETSRRLSDLLTYSRIAPIIRRYDGVFFDGDGRLINDRGEGGLRRYIAAFFSEWLHLVNKIVVATGNLDVMMPCSVPTSIDDWISRRLPGHGFRRRAARPEEESATSVTIEVSLVDYLDMLEVVAAVVDGEALPRKRGHSSPDSLVQRSTAFAYYVSAHDSDQLSSSELGDAMLSGILTSRFPKVLICTSEFQRLAQSLNDGATGTAAEWLAAALIHAHMHGCIETGVDSDGRVSVASTSPQPWRDARFLVEALSNWAQRYWHQDNEVVRTAFDDYIALDRHDFRLTRSAELVAQRVSRSGPAAIAALVAQVRRSPSLAKDELGGAARPPDDTHGRGSVLDSTAVS